MLSSYNSVVCTLILKLKFILKILFLYILFYRYVTFKVFKSISIAINKATLTTKKICS